MIHFHPITDPIGNPIFIRLHIHPVAPFGEIRVLSSGVIASFVHMFICLRVASLGLYTAIIWKYL